MPAEWAVARSAFVTRGERPMWDLNCAKKFQTWGTKWCTSRECGYQFSSEFDSRNRETVPPLRSVNFARKQN
jgi:hypothetical protein